MAVITAEAISSLALELLVRSLVLPRTCARVPGAEFSGPNGATITVRVRQPRASRVQATPGAPINYDDVNETSVDVTVRHLYDATRVSDEDLTLSIESFGAQVTAPQVASIAIGAENEVAAAMNALETDVDFMEGEVEEAVLGARETLGDNEVPLGGRWLAVSPQVATELLKLDKFSRVDASGSPSALREAVIGKIYGFGVVESAALDDYTTLAYHQSGIVFANRPPAVPQGAASAATANNDGIALRQVFDYDVSILSDVSAVSTFAGASVIYEDGTSGTDLKRVVKLELTLSS